MKSENIKGIRTESFISAKKAVNNIRKHGLGIYLKLIYEFAALVPLVEPLLASLASLYQATGMTKISRGGYFRPGGGILVFPLRGGYIPPPGKTGSSAFSAIWALIKLN